MTDRNNMGEGNREADRRYRKGVRETVNDTTHSERADKARDVDAEEIERLRDAEAEATSRKRD